MDPGGIGALIGIGVMVCGAISYCVYDNRTDILRRIRQYFSNHAQQKPLLPVVKENPLFVRRMSKQWKVKEIIVSK